MQLIPTTGQVLIEIKVEKIKKSNLILLNDTKKEIKKEKERYYIKAIGKNVPDDFQVGDQVYLIKTTFPTWPVPDYKEPKYFSVHYTDIKMYIKKGENQ